LRFDVDWLREDGPLSKEPPESGTSRRKRRGRRWPWLLLLGVVAIGVLVWSLRDVPHRQVERVLAERLGARVEIETIELLSARHAVLRGVRLTSPSAFPQVESVEAERVEAIAGAADMIAARFERVVIGPTEVVLRPQAELVRAPALLPEAEEGPAATAEELVLEGVTLRVAGDDEPLRVIAEGVLADWGGAFHGRLRLTGRALQAGTLAALAGRPLPEGLSAEAERMDARLRIAAAGERVWLRGGLKQVAVVWGGRQLAIPDVAVAGLGSPLLGPRTEIALRAEAGGWGSWLARLVWEAGAEGPAVQLSGRDLDPTRLRPWLPEGVLREGDGRVRGVARLARDGTVSGRARAALRGLPAMRAEARWRPHDEGSRLGLSFAAARAPAAAWRRALRTAGVDPAGLPWVERVEGRLELRGSGEGPPGRLGWRGTASFEGLALAGEAGGWRVDRGSGELRLRGEGTAGPVRGELRLEARAGLGPLAPRDLSVTAAGEMAPADGSIAIDEASLRVTGLGAARGGGTWSAEGWTGEARHDGLELAALAKWLDPVLPLPEDWDRPRGTLEAEVALEGGDGRATALDGRLSVEGAAWSSRDGTRAFEGLSGAWDVSGRLESGRMRAEAEGDLEGPLLLWRSAFGDLGGVSAGTRLELVGPPGPAGRSWEAALSAELPAKTELEAEARLAPGGGLEATGRLRSGSLGAAYRKLVVEPFAGGGADALPGISGGTLDVEASWRSDGEGPSALRGRLRAGEVDLAGPEAGWQVEDLDLDLPFDLERSGAGFRSSGGERRGELAFAQGRLSGITLSGVRTPLRVRGVTAALVQPIELRVAGGSVVLRGVELDPGLGGAPRAQATVEISGIELEALMSAAGLPALPGRLEGRFPRVGLEGSALQVEGGGKVDVFGGTLEIGEIAGEDVFSPFPRLSFSARFDGIRLGQVTRTFSFGEISGVVAGYVRDCVLVGGVPVRFEAEVRTVDVDGVGRTIAVKAINNLAILGTGGEVSVLDRGLHRFLDKYTYDRIGIHATLTNDRFLLRGLEHEGDKELFLEGRLPLPIDIVNARPGQTIGFRSMLDRLKRIDFSAATTGERKVD
jgi:hypothetical protein